MFFVRPYREEDAAACGDCLYEGFFSCPVEGKDWILLRDYAQVLIEKCNFTYVAEDGGPSGRGLYLREIRKDLPQSLGGAV